MTRDPTKSHADKVCILCVCILLSSCTTRSSSGPPVTRRGILLKRNLTPGTQLVYTFNSRMTENTVTERQELNYQLDMRAEVCETVVEYDAAKDVALIGLIGESSWRMKRGENAPACPATDQIWCAAYRVDKRGKSLRKQADKVPANLVRLHRELGQLSQNSQVCAPFPEQRIRVGEEWEGLVLLPLAGMRLPRKATSRIERIYEDDGRLHCVIKSDISLGGRDFYIGWKPGVCLPDMDVRGSAEGVFDADDGVWREMKWKLNITFDGRGFSGKRVVASNIKLFRQRQRTGPMIDLIRDRTRSFDNAIKLLYACDLEAALKVLDRDPGDIGWAKAFELTANLVRSFLDPEAAGKERSVTGLPMPKGKNRDSLALYKQAGEQAKAGDIDKAIVTYERFVRESADDEVVPARVRILAKIRSAGLLEKQGRADDALTAYRGVLTMAGDDKYSLKLKDRAREKLAAADGKGEE